MNDSKTASILTPGKNCWGVYEVRRAGLLIDGRDYYRAFYHAARKAKHYLLLAGWQFDPDVPLLRGPDARGRRREEVLLLPFLESLLRNRPELEIYILAWDFTLLFVLQKEWFRKWISDWQVHERLHFRLDNQHPLGASHHQKFAVIDGRIAFVGGMDICANEWDDRRHLPSHPDRRIPSGEEYPPFHDVQGYLAGPAAEKIAELFASRWLAAGGGELRLPSPPAGRKPFMRSSLPLAARRAAISRTQARILAGPQDSIQEIRSLYLEAIAAAEELIYMENQYFTSRAIYEALVGRMREAGRPKLEIVLVLPPWLHTFQEEWSHGIVQQKLLQSLREVACRTGHFLGVYSPAHMWRGERIGTYIHSKLLLVDDQFLSVGSANTTNRSLGFDTELNVAWEAHAGAQDAGKLRRSLRRARVSLLAEHTGLRRWRGRRRLGRRQGLVAVLDEVAGDRKSRLAAHRGEIRSGLINWLKEYMEDLAFDPDRPFVEENIYELLNPETPLWRGAGKLKVWSLPGVQVTADETLKPRAGRAAPAFWLLRILRSLLYGKWFSLLLLGISLAALLLFLLYGLGVFR